MEKDRKNLGFPKLQQHMSNIKLRKHLYSEHSREAPYTISGNGVAV